MDVRITRAVNPGEAVLFIGGWLQADNVCELKRELEQTEGPVVLEVSQLQSADAVGVATLRDILSRGAEMRGASGYIRLLLQNTRPANGGAKS